MIAAAPSRSHGLAGSPRTRARAHPASSKQARTADGGAPMAATYRATTEAAPTAARAGPANERSNRPRAAPISPTCRPEMARRCAMPASANRVRSGPGRSSRSASTSALATGPTSGGRRRRRRREAAPRAAPRRRPGDRASPGTACPSGDGGPSRPTTIPTRPGRRGQADGRPTRTHSPITVTEAPAGSPVATVSTRATRREIWQVRAAPPSRATSIETRPRVRRRDRPGSDPSRASPRTVTGSPLPSEWAHEAAARVPADEPSTAPATRPATTVAQAGPADRRPHRRGACLNSSPATATARRSARVATGEYGEGTGSRRPRATPRQVTVARNRRGGTRRGLAPDAGLRAPLTRRPARPDSDGASGGS